MPPIANKLERIKCFCYLSKEVYPQKKYSNNSEIRGYKGEIMNKGDLVGKVAQDCDLSKAVAEKALNSVMEAILEAVSAGDKVTLIGFT